MKHFQVLFLALLGILLTPVVALAAPEQHITTVDLRPMLEELLLTVGTVVLALVMFGLRQLGAYLSAKTGLRVLEQEALYRQVVESAMQNGLNYARQVLRDSDWTQVDVRNEGLAVAAQYVVNSVPDGLAKLGLDEEGVLTRLEARLRQEPAPSAPARRGARA